jgi:bis(5'-nucleosidyl)-tetraphosphatase
MHKKIHSYGVIPLRKHHGVWQTLLVQHGKGHWAFPKGHPEKGELPEQTASRELNEETGLKIDQLLALAPLEERYSFRSSADLIDKTVTYFAATVFGEIALQSSEISDYRWLSLEEAQHTATFAQTRALCVQVLLFLKESP